jgi:hypothetical protein
VTLVTSLHRMSGENNIQLFPSLDLREHRFDTRNMCSYSFFFSLGATSGRSDQSDRFADATSRDLVDALTEARRAVDALVRALDARQADSRPFLPDSLRNKAHEAF